MKIKNITNDERVIRVKGELILFKPNQVLDVDIVNFDSNVFSPVNEEKVDYKPKESELEVSDNHIDLNETVETEVTQVTKPINKHRRKRTSQ